MTRLKTLYAAFLASPEGLFIRQHGVLLMACGAVVVVCALGAMAAR